MLWVVVALLLFMSNRIRARGGLRHQIRIKPARRGVRLSLDPPFIILFVLHFSLIMRRFQFRCCFRPERSTHDTLLFNSKFNLIFYRFLVSICYI